MKKFNLPLMMALALFGALSFTSCKKDYTCACRVGVPLVYDTTINIQMDDFTKKQAKKACEGNENTIQTVSAAFISSFLGSFQDSSMIVPPNIPLNNLISASCELK